MPTFGVQTAFTEKDRLTTPRTSFFVETPRNEVEYELKSLHFHTLFYNSGDAEPVFLDGRAALDGAWTLSQKFRGIMFPQVSFRSSFTFPEAASVGSLAFSPMGVTNYTSESFEAFRALTETRNATRTKMLDFRLNLKAPRHNIEQKLAAVSFFTPPVKNGARYGFDAFRAQAAEANGNRLGSIDAEFPLRAKQGFSISASLTMDSMYELGGSVLLDGSRKLNANIIKEDI